MNPPDLAGKRQDQSPLRRAAACVTVLLLLYCLYLFCLTGTGLLGQDEPRYAAIGRTMARSGDWITPRLWGQPWFEKPPLLYWMTAAAFRLGLGEESAPRLPVALLSLLFLVFFHWSMRREFGGKAAWYATAILASCAGWLSFSYIAVPDLPMSVFFSASMLLGMIWSSGGDRRWLVGAAASLGLAVLAKSLVPLVLAIPFAWHARARWREFLQWQPIAAFFAMAAPWHVFCYVRNGTPFLQTLFWEHQFQRFTTSALQHPQPFWFYLAVMPAALFPWTPVVALLFRRRLYSDARCGFLLLWLVFGLVFFSAGVNKLPGYILPLLPAAAALTGIALGVAGRGARWVLGAATALLCLVFPIASILPQALAEGLSRVRMPSWSLLWTTPVALAATVWYLECRRRRSAAVVVMVSALTAAVIYLKLVSFPAIDASFSARPLWRRIADAPGKVCIDKVDRIWRYGLNYYLIEPLPDCSESARPVQVTQSEGGAVITSRGVQIK